MKSYYAWCGVGAIRDMDGNTLPMASTRAEAWEIFRRHFREDKHDWTLWERDGFIAHLLAAVHDSFEEGTRHFYTIDGSLQHVPAEEEKPKKAKKMLHGWTKIDRWKYQCRYCKKEVEGDVVAPDREDREEICPVRSSM